MDAYRQAETPDRIKAGVGVAVVHVVLAAIILSGLDVRIIRQQVERLKTFDISEDALPPPQPLPPPEPPDSSAPTDEAAPANIRSKPTPVEAPTPPIPLPIEQKLNVSQVHGPEGADRTAGAAAVPGGGTGVGGQGSGFGGGGSGGLGNGTGSFIPAQRITPIPRREYRRVVAVSGVRRGSVQVTLRVNPDGLPSDCRVARSSGIAAADALLCDLTLRYVRFRPARDPQGRPVAQDVTWVPRWTPGR